MHQSQVRWVQHRRSTRLFFGQVKKFFDESKYSKALLNNEPLRVEWGGRSYHLLQPSLEQFEGSTVSILILRAQLAAAPRAPSGAASGLGLPASKRMPLSSVMDLVDEIAHPDGRHDAQASILSGTTIRDWLKAHLPSGWVLSDALRRGYTMLSLDIEHPLDAYPWLDRLGLGLPWAETVNLVTVDDSVERFQRFLDTMLLASREAFVVIRSTQAGEAREKNLERNRLQESAWISMSLLANYQVEYLVELSQRVAELSEHRQTAVLQLQRELIDFTHRVWQVEVTPREFSQAVWDVIQRSRHVDRLYTATASRVREVTEYSEGIAQKDLTSLANVAAFVGLPLTLYFAMTGAILASYPSLTALGMLLVTIGVYVVYERRRRAWIGRSLMAAWHRLQVAWAWVWKQIRRLWAARGREAQGQWGADPMNETEGL